LLQDEGIEGVAILARIMICGNPQV
jgi:hypothetical protein